MRRALIWVVTGLLMGALADLKAQDVHAFITRDSITIGDQFELWIQANVSSEDFNWTSENRDLGGLEIIEWGIINPRGDAQDTGFEQKLTIQAWEEGLQWIPQLSYLIGQDSFQTDSILVPVYPIQLDTNQLTVLPDKGLRTAEFEWRELKKYWWLPLVAMILLALLIYIIRKSKKTSKEKTVVLLAHEWAFEQLDRLKKSKLTERGELKSYYSQLSYILRSYLERRYGIQALEKTTREIMRSPLRNIIDAQEQYKLRQGLETMDLVKFAKYRPEDDQHDQALRKIYDFVQMTKENPALSKDEES